MVFMRNGYIFLKNETILQLIIFYFLKQYLNSRKGMFKNMKKQGCLGGGNKLYISNLPHYSKSP